MRLLCAMIVGGVSSAWAETVTDVLTQSWTGVSGTTYSPWSGKAGSSSDAVYAGNSAGGNSSIQLRTTNNNSGVVTTTSGGKARKITVTWNASTSADRTLNVYGKNSAYSAATELYNTSNQGTLIGTIAKGTSTLSITDDYEYIGFRSASGAMYLTKVEIEWEVSGGDDPGLTASNLELTGAPVALRFDLYNNSTAQTISYTTSSTGAVTVGESDYATFDVNESAKTITVTPKTTVTPSAQTITVSQAADATYNAGSATFTVTVTDSTPIPNHTATFSVNGTTSTGDFEEGATITFPSNPADISGKTFVGWATAAIDGATNEAPALVTSATMGTSDLTYYAVFAYSSGSGPSEVTDVLNLELTGVSGTSYSAWSEKTATSSAVYAGRSAGGNSSIQLNSSSPNGIVSTTSGGKAKKVKVSWNTNTAAGRTIGVYGSTKAYESASELYTITTTNKQIGTIVKGTSTELEISADYEYIGIRSESSALYLDEVKITWSTGGGITYSDYCTTVVAATVERPVITVANTFTISTTATITCATEGAAIKYSYDGENWSDYTVALTITETKTIYAKAIKGSDESDVVSVTATKNLAEPSVTIDATGITNTDVYTNTAAGSLAASVTYNDAAVAGATVTWSGNNDEVATINASTGAVTLVAAGSVTFTATYAANSDYSEKSATYEMTVTNSDPNAPGTENNPYTVAQAIAATPASGTSDNVYIRGIVSKFYKASIVEDGTNYRYYISNDGTTTDQLLVFKGKKNSTDNFSEASDLLIGDEVVIYGGLTTYSGTKEVAADNYIVSRKTLPGIAWSAATFEAGIGIENAFPTLTNTNDVAVTYSSTETGVATIAVDGTITLVAVGETTIKAAFAGNDSYLAQEVSYTLTVVDPTVPAIVLGTTTIEATAAGADGTISLDYTNLTISDMSDFDVQFYDADGNELSGSDVPDWVEVLVAEQDPSVGTGYVVSYIVEANTNTVARTAYFKVFALGASDFVYSEKVTVTQEAYVPSTTYTLASSITSGKHYLIVGYKSDVYQAMGEQKSNNRTAVNVTLSEGKISITDEAVSEVVIYGPDASGYYTIYDSNYDNNKGGYLYAAASGSNNMKSQQTNNVNGKWNITFDDGVASIVATESSNRNVMQYNNSSTLFSCYASASQGAVYLYEKDGDAPVSNTVSVTLNAKGYATFASTSALDFLDADAAGIDYSAWQITGASGTTLTFTQVTNHVKAGTGILLKGTPGATITLNILPTGGETLSTNKFEGVTAEKTVAAGEYYGLSGKTFVPVGAGTVPAGKALLPVSAVTSGDGGVKSLNIDLSGTGLQMVQGSGFKVQDEGAVYDLSGRRVEKPTKGIYIVNGKKVLK